MGVEICTYRKRIGLFEAAMKHKAKFKERHSNYTQYTKGDDIHWRTLTCCMILLYIVVLYRVLLEGHHVVVNTFASDVDTQCFDIHCHIFSSTGEFGNINGKSATTVTVKPMVFFYRSTYVSYCSRLLILASDIESNPGPTEDTLLILNQINEMKDSYEKTRNETV